MQRVARMVADEICNRYDEEQRARFVFCAAPAHNEATTRRRLDAFSALVCRYTGMADGTRHVHVIGNAPAKHLTGIGVKRSAYRVDSHVFGYRDVILFDDVTTTGHTIRTFASFVEEQHGHVMGAYFIAKTKIL